MTDKFSANPLYFIFGNQSFELKAEVKKIVNELLTSEEQEHSLFRYSANDFFGQDRKRAAQILSDFRSTCETISFFASKTVIVLQDVQAIPSQKSPIDTLETKLKEINLVKLSGELKDEWVDADSLTEQLETHHHITGNQIVREIECYPQKTFYLNLIPEFHNRLIYRKKGKGQDALEIAEFLKSKIKGKLLFNRPTSESPISQTDHAEPIAVIKHCVESVPSHVVLITTANIKNLKEVNKEIGELLQKNAISIKKTISYDNFRPISWVIGQVKNKQLVINTPTADLLIEVAGTDFNILDMELDKLSILLPAGTEVTPKVLMKSITQSRRYTIFRAAEFLLKRDLRNALECVEQVVGENISDAIGLFSLIVSQFRRILRISWLMEAGFVEKTIVDKLKLNPWAARQSIKATGNFTIQELENIVVYLAKLDLQIKYAARDVLVILENICFQICQGALVSKKPLSRSWTPK